MKRIAFALLSVAVVLAARERKLPSGQAENDVVSLRATLFDTEELKQVIGSDFGNHYQVAEVTVTPKTDKGIDLRLDDFLMRSDSDGDHSGPMAASQIAGSGVLVLKSTGQGGTVAAQPTQPTFGIPGMAPSGGGIGNTRGGEGERSAEMKSDTPEDPYLKVLQSKIPKEGHLQSATTGLLFFPIEKQKPKSLELVYTTPTGKVRLRFKQ